MPNNASHCLDKQALQIQAKQLLPPITKALAELGYLNIAHQRLSQQNHIRKNYQGLSRAAHKQFGQLMIKWQISADSVLDVSNLPQINHEIAVLQALNKSQNTAKESIAIAPSLLAFEVVTLDLAKDSLENLAPNQTLTLLAMPYYSQGNLARYLKQTLTIEQKHQLMVKAAQLVKSLHGKGWLHNDIKPSNILINEGQSLLLTDFALAERLNNSDSNKSNLKNSAGTPAYLAPERWQGQGASIQSDLYALGIMMYEILASERPFAIESSTSESLTDWALQHCQQPIPTLPSQYSDYQDIVEKALGKLVSKRYLSMEEILEDLQKL